jgi:sugar phosphate isomerase/epimerase
VSRQFSLGHLTIIKVPTPELIRIAARTGYDYVSPRLMSGGLPGPDQTISRDPELLRQTRAALAETGMAIHDIELARIADGIDPAGYEPDLAIGAELGARAVLSSIWSADRQRAVDDFGRLCRLAAQYGQTVNLEFVPIASVRTMADALAVIAEVNEPNARLLIDLHHLHRSRESLDAVEAVPAQLLEFAQICDAPGPIPADQPEMTRIIRAGREYLGEGGTDPAAMLRRLPNMVYAIEIPSARAEQRLGAEAHARRCLETSRAYLDRELPGSAIRRRDTAVTATFGRS